MTFNFSSVGSQEVNFKSNVTFFLISKLNVCNSAEKFRFSCCYHEHNFFNYLLDEQGIRVRECVARSGGIEAQFINN